MKSEHESQLCLPVPVEFHEPPFPHLQEEGDDSTPFTQPLGRPAELCF